MSAPEQILSPDDLGGVKSENKSLDYAFDDNELPPEITSIITELETAHYLLSGALKESLQETDTEKDGDEELATVKSTPVFSEDEEILKNLREILQEAGLKDIKRATDHLTYEARMAFKALELLTKSPDQKRKGIESKLEAEGTLDSMQLLMREAGRYRLLKPSEEIELAKRIEAGDLAAKERMINSNIRLVVALARRYQGQGLALGDLIQEGSLGLIRAVEKFDWRLGFRFSTYATLWIRQAMQRGLENTSRTIRLPVHVAQRSRKVGRIERELTTKLGHEPTVGEIAEAAELSVEAVIEIQDAERAVTSLDKPIGEDGDTTFGELIADKRPGTAVKAMNNLRNERLYAAISNLKSPQKEVIEMRFGMDGNPPITLKEVAEYLGISAKTACRIEEAALKKLSNYTEICDSD